MKLLLSYPYKEVCGIFKVRLEFENEAENLNSTKIVLNEISHDLNLDQSYLLSKNIVEFGINSYRVTEKESSTVTIKLLINDLVADQIIINCNNDERLAKSISGEMLKLPVLIGLPIDSKLFASLNLQEYPSNYLFKPEFKSFEQDGFLIIKNFYNPNFMDEVADELDFHCDNKYKGYQEGSSMRLEHLHLLGGRFADLFKDLKIRKFLDDMYGVEMIPCQSLGYKFGSQQSIHSDFVHLTPYPTNLMCGVWVALEDVMEGSGELLFYPGTHKYKKFVMNDFGLPKVNETGYGGFDDTFSLAWSNSVEGIQPNIANLNKGDVLIWDGNLLHAGSTRKNLKITRRSVVFHFFAKGAPCYYDATGDIGFLGELN